MDSQSQLLRKLPLARLPQVRSKPPLSGHVNAAFSLTLTLSFVSFGVCVCLCYRSIYLRIYPRMWIRLQLLPRTCTFPDDLHVARCCFRLAVTSLTFTIGPFVNPLYVGATTGSASVFWKLRHSFGATDSVDFSSGVTRSIIRFAPVLPCSVQPSDRGTSTVSLGYENDFRFIYFFARLRGGFDV